MDASVEIYPGVFVSKTLWMFLKHQQNTQPTTNRDPIEDIVIKAAKEAKAEFGVIPFVQSSGQFYAATEAVHAGHPPERMVALYSEDPKLVNGSNGNRNNVVASQFNGGTKPSKDPYNRLAVNAKLRLPVGKLRSHRPPKQIRASGVQYGQHIVHVGLDRIREYNPPQAQTNKLDQLLGELRTYQSKHGRQSRLMELFDDLRSYPTTLLPVRKAYDNLLSVLSAAVTGNMQIDIQLIYNNEVGLKYNPRIKVPVGYVVRPIH